MTTRHFTSRHVLTDTAILVISCICAFLLIYFQVVHQLVASVGIAGIFMSIVAGFFFTSVFTTPPAIVALVELGQSYPPVAVAALGACGALIGDFILFFVVKNHVANDISLLLSTARHKRFGVLFKNRSFQWVLSLVGAVVIATPFLPDELGIALMGIVRLKPRAFAPLSLAFNFIGILIVTVISRQLV